jgi:hypothetical protein
MNWFNSFFTAILSGLAGWLIADLRSLTKKYKDSQNKSATEADAIRDGVRCLLHSKLFDFYAEYKDAPSLPTQTWKEIDRVYEVYHALDGNGTGSRIYEALKAKPLEPEDK